MSIRPLGSTAAVFERAGLVCQLPFVSRLTPCQPESSRSATASRSVSKRERNRASRTFRGRRGMPTGKGWGACEGRERPSPNFPPPRRQAARRVHAWAHRRGAGGARARRSEPDRRLAGDCRRGLRPSRAAGRAPMAAASRKARSRGAAEAGDARAQGRRRVRARGSAHGLDNHDKGQRPSGLALRRQARLPARPAAAA
jgi:hypothetical protein